MRRYSFGTGAQALPIPELTPFRLTRQLRSALAPHDALELLRAPAALGMAALRSGAGVLEARRPLLPCHWLPEWRACTAGEIWPCLLIVWSSSQHCTCILQGGWTHRATHTADMTEAWQGVECPGCHQRHEHEPALLRHEMCGAQGLLSMFLAFCRSFSITAKSGGVRPLQAQMG